VTGHFYLLACPLLIMENPKIPMIYHEILHSLCTLHVSYKSLAVHSSAMLYASDLYGIEEEIIFPSSNDNEEYDDEDILLEIKPCILFGTELFPHHDDIFLQTMCDFVPSSMQMTNQKHVLCLDDFSDGEPLPVIARKPTVEKPAIGEQALCRSSRFSTGLLFDVSHSNCRYNQPIGHVFFNRDALVTINTIQDLEDREFPDAPYPLC